jgi:hypothetical protein
MVKPGTCIWDITRRHHPLAPLEMSELEFPIIRYFELPPNSGAVAGPDCISNLVIDMCYTDQNFHGSL